MNLLLKTNWLKKDSRSPHLDGHFQLTGKIMNHMNQLHENLKAVF